MAKDSIVFHQTYQSLDPLSVSDKVVTKVNELYKSNYHKIKVIVHDPVTQVSGDGTTRPIFITTVIATRDDVRIDIGFNSPT